MFIQEEFNWPARLMMEELTARKEIQGSTILEVTLYGKPGLITYLIRNR